MAVRISTAAVEPGEEWKLESLYGETIGRVASARGSEGFRLSHSSHSVRPMPGRMVVNIRSTGRHQMLSIRRRSRPR